MNAPNIRRLFTTTMSILVLLLAIKTGAGQCSCFAQLKYREVSILTVPTGYNHAFWWLSMPDGEVFTIDAGPSGSCPLSCGQLIDWITPGNTGHYAEDTYTAPSSYMAAPSTSVCQSTGQMYTLAYTWNSSTQAYVLAGSPNSNTFAHELATIAGWTFITSPPNAIGW